MYEKPTTVKCGHESKLIYYPAHNVYIIHNIRTVHVYRRHQPTVFHTTKYLFIIIIIRSLTSLTAGYRPYILYIYKISIASHKIVVV